jgi:hypothetical protein
MQNGGQLAGDLVHVRDHQQQALRRRERRRQRAGLQAPCTAPAAPPSDCISTTSGRRPRGWRALRGPFVGELAHRRGRRDRVDGDDFREAVRHARAAASFPVEGDL